MAHPKNEAAAHPETLLFPLQFRASIHRVADTTRVGDWIIGFLPEDQTAEANGEEDGEENQDQYIPGDLPQEWEFDRLPVEWLASYLSLVREHSQELRSSSPAPDTVMRALVGSGTFREEDWVETERILKGAAPIGERVDTLPSEVTDQVRRLNVRGDKKIYLIRIDDFWLEWRLLESLALLAGYLGEKQSIVGKPRSEARKAWLLLEQLNSNASGSDPRSSPNLPPSRSLPDHARMLIRDVVRQAFRRVFKNPKTMFQFGLKNGPGFTLEATSILSVAYLILLRNFARGWKRCKRPDCQKVFPITDDKRKVFCSQYCGHVESQRKNRRERRAK